MSEKKIRFKNVLKDYQQQRYRGCHISLMHHPYIPEPRIRSYRCFANSCRALRNGNIFQTFLEVASSVQPTHNFR